MGFLKSFKDEFNSLNSINKSLTSSSTGSAFSHASTNRILPTYDSTSSGDMEKSPKSKVADFMKEEKYGKKREEDVWNIPTRTMRRMYRYNPVVRAAVDTIINEITAAKWQVAPIDQEENVEPLQKDIKRIEHFFRHPNKNKENFKSLLRKILYDVLLIDGGVIEKVKRKDGKGLAEIYAIDGSTMRIKTDEYGMIQKYYQVIDEKAIEPVSFERDEIIYVQNWSRPESVYGISPLETLHNSVTAFLYGENYNIKFFENNATPKGIVDLGGMVPERELDRFRQFWEAEQQQKPHRIMILGNIGNPDKPGAGVKWIPIAMQPKDYDMAKYLEWLMKIILMVYGVSPSKVGWTEEVRGAPATGQILQAQAFKEKAIYPIMEKLAWYFTEEIIYQEFGNDKLKFEFVEESSLQDKLLKAQIQQYQIMAQTRTVDELRKEDGLKSIQQQSQDGGTFEQGQNEEQEPFDISEILHGLKGENKPILQDAYKDLENNIKQHIENKTGESLQTTNSTIESKFKDLEQNIKNYINKSFKSVFTKSIKDKKIKK